MITRATVREGRASQDHGGLLNYPSETFPCVLVQYFTEGFKGGFIIERGTKPSDDRRRILQSHKVSRDNKRGSSSNVPSVCVFSSQNQRNALKTLALNLLPLLAELGGFSTPIELNKPPKEATQKRVWEANAWNLSRQTDKKNSDQTHSCPRHQRLSASWSPNWGPPWNPSQQYCIEGFKGSLNWTDVSEFVSFFQFGLPGFLDTRTTSQLNKHTEEWAPHTDDVIQLLGPPISDWDIVAVEHLLGPIYLWWDYLFTGTNL